MDIANQNPTRLSPLETARVQANSQELSLRSRRQWEAIVKWLIASMKGTAEWPTGAGKTRIGLEVIKLLRRNDSTRQVIIVVPTLQLKDQWEQELRSINQLDSTQVWVINSLVNQSDNSISCKLLVLDEIHRYAADTFSRVFKVVQYNWVLGLTATLNRMDGKHILLKEKAPIIDSMTIAYAKRAGFVSDYRVYNLGVTLSEEEQTEYNTIHSRFVNVFSRFGQNLDLMRKCSFGLEPRFFARTGTFAEPYVVSYARRLGWRGRSSLEAHEAIRTGTPKSRAWGNEDHYNSPKTLNELANAGMQLMRKRKNFVNNNSRKVDAAVELIRAFDVKTVTFGESISQAEELASRLGNIARTFHSKVESQPRQVLEEKQYKTETGANNWIVKHPEWHITHKRGKIFVQRHVSKMISGAQRKREALHSIRNLSSVKVICTARALDEGFDFPGAQLGIMLARTQNPRQNIQRMGRIVRRFTLSDGTEKEAVIVNIYLKNTKEPDWLRKAQVKSLGAFWVNSVDEIIASERSGVRGNTAIA